MEGHTLPTQNIPTYSMFHPQHAIPELPFHAWSLSVLSLPLWIEISWVLFILQYPVQTGSSPLLAESGHKAPPPCLCFSGLIAVTTTWQ